MFKKKLRPEGPSARKGRRESVRCVRSYTMIHKLPLTKILSGNFNYSFYYLLSVFIGAFSLHSIFAVYIRGLHV